MPNVKRDAVGEMAGGLVRARVNTVQQVPRSSLRKQIICPEIPELMFTCIPTLSALLWQR